MPSKNAKRILSVKIIHETDMHYNGEDSIGTFDTEAKSEYAIPLEYWDESHGYRYDGGFKFYNAPVGNYAGESPEDIRKYVQQDYASMRFYNAGEWDYIGILAVCTVQVTPNGPIQKLSSGGLWGIESNAGDYLEDVAQEQLSELKVQLKAIGFSARAISTAFKSAKTEVS
jgi:hypothetical protein